MENTIEARPRATVMLVILCHQLDNWLRFALNQKNFRHSAKQRASILKAAADSFMYELKKHLGNDFLFEESAEFSDMLEQLLALNETDRKRISGLIAKLLKEKEHAVQG